MNDAFVHANRLASDFQSMQRLSGPIITWQGAPAANPAQRIYPGVYRVTYNILAPTVKGNARVHTIEIDCSSLDYPANKPHVHFITPVVKHPHFWGDGNVCLGGFPVEESLAALCVRLGHFLLYDPTLINKGSIASPEFERWYMDNRSRLPLERVQLPEIEDEVAGGMRVKERREGSSDSDGGGMTVRHRTPGNDTNW